MSEEFTKQDDRAANTAAGGNTPDAPNAKPKRHRGVLTTVIVVLALAVIAFCAWSMSQYVQGNDPIAMISGKPAAVEASSSDAESDQQAADETAASEEGTQEAQQSDGSSTASAGAAADTAKSQGAASAPAASNGSSAGAKAKGNKISVSITVDGSAGGAGSASATITLPKGSTPYDALVATGMSVNARPTSFGTYVAAINGLAEKEHGATSGWLYSVNGVEPNKACDAVTLSDGDTVNWHYTAG
ncbi:MAG: DUF4430 domain-containing protein [Coriobacteriales bacterium]|nr:DUF4430 domain-containing protein [Coriobacteriales bacterium]MDY5661892.1 DUF4430 domain-containing protein [Coriobacteriales bacterium]